MQSPRIVSEQQRCCLLFCHQRRAVVAESSPDPRSARMRSAADPRHTRLCDSGARQLSQAATLAARRAGAKHRFKHGNERDSECGESRHRVHVQASNGVESCCDACIRGSESSQVLSLLVRELVAQQWQTEAARRLATQHFKECSLHIAFRCKRGSNRRSHHRERRVEREKRGQLRIRHFSGKFDPAQG